jgi:hypothetical protein
MSSRSPGDRVPRGQEDREALVPDSTLLQRLAENIRHEGIALQIVGPRRREPGRFIRLRHISGGSDPRRLRGKPPARLAR